MKPGWEVKTLGEVCRVVNGGTPDTKVEAYWGGTHRWITPAEMGKRLSPYVDATARTLSELGLKSCSARLLPPNSVILSSRAPIGHLVINREPMATNQGCRGLVPCDRLNCKFLYYYLLGIVDVLEALGTGTTFKELSAGKLKDVNIPVPPLAEQQRIVAFLDEAFAGIATARANAEKNLQNARALFESHLNAVFTQRGEGWVEKPVSEIAEHSLGKMLDRAKNKGCPQKYLRNLNVRWFSFDLDDLLEMRFTDADIERYSVRKGDVVICEGGYPGRAAIWDHDEPIYYQKALHRVRFHEPAHNKWFAYYLYAQDMSGQLRANFTGSGIQHFTGQALSKFVVPVPPVEVVHERVAQFDQLAGEVQRLESIYQRKITALDELKKSLLHEAFSMEN